MALTICANISCKEEKYVPTTWVVQEPDNGGEKNENNVKLGWTNVDKTFGDLPSYISVYKSPSTLQNKLDIAYIAVADMNKATFDILGDIVYDHTAKDYGSKSVSTLTHFYTKAKRSIIMNAGLFYYAESFHFSQNSVVK